jgi:drug/metabolite transporter (DMT)-like permease
MVFAALCWSGAFIAGKIGGEEVSGLEMSFYRFLIAVICLYFYGKGKKISFRISLRDVYILMGIGIFGMAGYHILFFKALRTIDVLEASAINTLNPLLSALFGFIIFREPLSRKGLLFLITAAFGVLTIVVKWNFSLLFSGKGASGTILMFSAMVILVIYSLLIRKFASGIKSVVSSFYTFTGASLFLLPFIAASGKSPITWSGNVWISIVFMGVFSTFLGYTIQQESISKIGVSRTNFFINFVPVFSMFLGVLILGDLFHMINILSLAIIIAGMIGYLGEKEKLSAAH